MTQPINLLVNLMGVSEIGCQEQIERDRPEGEKEHRALVIKEGSHLSESQVQPLRGYTTSRVEPRNEGGAFGGYYPHRRRKKEEGKK